MAKLLQEIFSICRLCLCQDEELLTPVKQIIDSTLSAEDIERFTGHQIHNNDSVSFAFCYNCTNALKNSVAFRSACLSNDVLFWQRCQVLFPCTESNIHESEESSNLFSTEVLEIELVLENNDILPHNEDVEETSNLVLRQCVLKSTDNESDDVDYIDKDNYSAYNVNPSEMQLSKDDEQMEKLVDYPTMEPIEQKLQLVSNKEYTKKGSDASDDKLLKVTSPTRVLSKLSKTLIRNRQLCSICGKMVANLSLHIPSHTKENKFACSYCPIKMNHPANLMRHVNAVHLKIIVKSCEICGKGFTHNNVYKSHMRSQHDIGESYECNICLKLFKYPCGLREHRKRFHNDEIKYDCSVCGKVFKTRPALKVHEKIHSEEKPYACNICGKRYKSRNAKNTHQLAHSGIVFNCTLCEKSYRYKTLLNIHTKKVHRDFFEESANG